MHLVWILAPGALRLQNFNNFVSSIFGASGRLEHNFLRDKLSFSDPRRLVRHTRTLHTEAVLDVIARSFIAPASTQPRAGRQKRAPCLLARSLHLPPQIQLY